MNHFELVLRLWAHIVYFSNHKSNWHELVIRALYQSSKVRALKYSIAYIQTPETTFDTLLHSSESEGDDWTTVNQYWAGLIYGGGGRKTSFPEGRSHSKVAIKRSERAFYCTATQNPWYWSLLLCLSYNRNAWAILQITLTWMTILLLQVKNAFRSYKKHSLAAVHKREEYLSRWSHSCLFEAISLISFDIS